MNKRETLKFELSRDERYYIVVGGDKYANSIVIPSVYNNLPIKEIGENAFYKFKMSSIVIPNSIVKIGNNAFDECRRLKMLELPDSVRYLGDLMCRNCVSLTTVKLSSQLQKINWYAFYNCKSLISADIPKDVRVVEIGAYEKCTNLVNLNLPNNLKIIKWKSFAFCTSIENIILPNKCSVDVRAFDGASKKAQETFKQWQYNNDFHFAFE
jgi:hypothetical protein